MALASLMISSIIFTTPPLAAFFCKPQTPVVVALLVLAFAAA